MRDVERWKDKVELSLDGRQIFFLFFGSAVAACLIFVAGVLIGKRLEARALALTPPPVEDPLAALDQLGEADDADEALTYHKTLTRDVKAPAAKAESKLESAPKIEAVKIESTPKIEAKPADAPKSAEAKPSDSETKPKLADLPRLPAGRPVVVAAAKPAAEHFTLQLSAFPEKSDAEEFMKKIQSAGYKPFVVVSEIPGKGVFYRVRVGDYASRDAAANAKTEFERKQRMIAYVAKL
jgi:DedD protein